MNQIKLIIKGFVVGLGKIIPGVSGGMLAMSLGVYEKGIQSVSHFFSDPKKNSLFLGMLGIGALFSITFLSGIIDFSLEHYYLPTMLLFIGLMLGGFSSIKKEVEGTNYKQYLTYLLLPFLLMMVLEFYKSDTIFVFDGSLKSYFFMFLFGMIDAITMIVPGISGTAILMLFGCYDMLLETFSHMLDLSQLFVSIKILLPFGMGMFIGVLLTIKLVSYLLEKHSISFYYIIISFFLSSIFLLLLQTLKQNYPVGAIIFGVLCFIIGYFSSKMFDIHYNS